jgi:short-subunit dehydrogenase
LRHYQGWFSRERASQPTKNPKVVLVTGATSGIGKATAILLVALGHQVVAVGRRSERLDELQSDCEELLGELLTVVADVTDSDQLLGVVGETLATLNRLDVLVANAGLGHRGQLVEAEWSDLEAVLRTNIDGVIHSIRACVPAMRASGGGKIIMVSSILGPIPAPGSAIYSASKAAIDSLAQSLRMELRSDNIGVTDILVGQTHTEFAKKRRGASGKVASKLPTMTPEKVASQIAWAMERNKRSIILRPLDRLIVIFGRFFPWVMDRVMYQVYR